MNYEIVIHDKRQYKILYETCQTMQIMGLAG